MDASSSGSAAAHLLDRPVWHALSTSHRQWAIGQGAALRYDADFAPFGGTVDDTPGSLADLCSIVPPGGTVALFTVDELAFPDRLSCIRRAVVEQMVQPTPPAGRLSHTADTDIRLLGRNDAAAARDLVALTKPGPFAARTLEMGRYLGVFRGADLVAMTGERMRLPGYVEISAVCTHPDHRGQGLAQELIERVARDAFDHGLVPFLHAFTDNAGALGVYRKLGFTSRRQLHLAVVKQA